MPPAAKGCGSPVETSAQQKHRPSRQARLAALGTRPLFEKSGAKTLNILYRDFVLYKFTFLLIYSYDEIYLVQWFVFDIRFHNDVIG